MYNNKEQIPHNQHEKCFCKVQGFFRPTTKKGVPSRGFARAGDFVRHCEASKKTKQSHRFLLKKIF